MKQYKANRLLLTLVITGGMGMVFVLLNLWTDLKLVDYLMLAWMFILALLSLWLPLLVSISVTFLATLIYGLVVLFSGTQDWMAPIGISYYYLLVPIAINISVAMVGQVNRKYLRVSESFETSYQALVRIDELTGFRNIKDYFDNLDEEINRANRYTTDLSLMLIHVESFDDLNKLYGYKQGEKFLKYLSEFIVEITRNVDKHYRIRDNVFAVVLPSTDHKGAEILKARFIEALESVNIVISKQEQQIEVDIDIVCEAFKQEHISAHQFHKSVEEQFTIKKEV